MTAGFRSTEFWLTATSFLCGVILAAHGAREVIPAAIYAGAAWAASSIIGYAHSAGARKAPRPYLPPPSRV